MSGEGLSLDQMDVSGGLQSHIITTLMKTDAYCDNYFSCVLLIAWFYIKLEYIPGNTPLHLAAFKGLFEIVKLLVESGADIDARNINKETPVCVSNRENHKEISEYLLEHKAKSEAGVKNRKRKKLLQNDQN